MDTIVWRSAGLDVHKKLIQVCVRVMSKSGKVKTFREQFGTMTRDLLALSAWLSGLGVTHVAMEATGVYWKPIYNILEGSFELLLCNAKHIKNVPGRKTDVTDSEWIAQLLQHGLLTGSFVPQRPLREMRDLTRHRAQITSERARQVNRIQKVLEDSNVKLSSVATDVLGKSGRDMLSALIAKQDDPKAIADLARGRLRGKIPMLELALEGHVTDHHRFMLKTHLEHVEYLEGVLERLDQRIEVLVASGALDPKASGQPSDARSDTAATENTSVPFDEAVALADGIPGIDVTAARTLLAEIGTDMSQFPSHKHLASWSRICPGNNESAGKRKSGKTGKGNPWLKRIMTQIAWAASRTKGTYYSAQYRRLVRRCGKKRAIMAVAHSILVTLYHMLKYRRHYKDLGEDFFDKLDPERVKRYHVKRLESLGFTVTLEREPDAA